jgi:hypothetical protein
VTRTARRKSVFVVLACVALIGVAVLGVNAAVGGDTPELPQGDDLLADINREIAGDENKSQDIGRLTLLKKGVFATTAGNPVDVDLLAGKAGVRCLSVSGDAYPSSVSCFQIKEAARNGSYQVVMPLGDAPIVVVGYAPNGNEDVAVNAGKANAAIAKHDNVFLASLPPGALGPDNAVKVNVVFGS